MKRLLVLLLALCLAIGCVAPAAIAEEKKPAPMTGYDFILKLAMYAGDYKLEDVMYHPRAPIFAPPPCVTFGEDGGVTQIGFMCYRSYIEVLVDSKTQAVQEIVLENGDDDKKALPFFIAMLYLSADELRDNYTTGGDGYLNADFSVIAKHLAYPVSQVIETGESYSDEKFTFSLEKTTGTLAYLSIVPKQ